MSDEIIDLRGYRGADDAEGIRPPTLSVWGADGDRSRFALPLWRIAHLTGSQRGVIYWQDMESGGRSAPFVAVDLMNDPPRLHIDPARLPYHADPTSATLHDLGSEGVVICLGSKEGRAWYVLADGRQVGRGELTGATREAVLFLAGECAGLLFLLDMAQYVEPGGSGEPGS